MASLRLVPVSGAPTDITKDPSHVGREPSCEVVVSDGSVSRRHARLEQRGGTWFVVDLGSANGTYVNSLKVAEHALKNGQELRFGALAFRVDVMEDPEATVARPVVADDSATVMAPAVPPPVPPPPMLPPGKTPTPVTMPPPLPPAAPTPPSAAAARERFRAPGAPAPPVPQMPAGGPPPRKGKSPLFWVAIGCCGCLALVGLLAAVIGGGVLMATKAPVEAAHAWLQDVREGRADEAKEGLSRAYESRLSPEELETLESRIRESKDATFFSRSVDSDTASLRGILTGGGAHQPIHIRLVKEGGRWKVDDVQLEID